MSAVNYQQALYQELHQKLHQEIDQTPREYLGALLNIVHTFRESVSLPEPQVSIEQGLKELMVGETHDVSTLWNDINAE